MKYDAIFDAKPRCLWEDNYLLERIQCLRMKVNKGDEVLDLASGTGRLMKPFGTKYHALDQDAKMLALNYGAHKILGDYSLIETMKDDLFSLVTFFFGNTNSKKHLAYISREVYRSLKQGGTFFAVIYGKGRLDSFVYPSLFEWGKFAQYSPRELVELYRDVGFSNVHVQGMTPSVLDLFEKLPPNKFDTLQRKYMRSGLGNLNIPFLRWHYVVVECVK